MRDPSSARASFDAAGRIIYWRLEMESQFAVFKKTVVLLMTENDVIEKPDPRELAFGLQFLCDLFVVLAWSDSSGGMIVYHDESCGTVGGGVGKHLPGVYVNSVDQADRYASTDGKYFSCAVQGNAEEVLLFVRAEMADEGQDIGWPGDSEAPGKHWKIETICDVGLSMIFPHRQNALSSIIIPLNLINSFHMSCMTYERAFMKEGH